MAELQKTSFEHVLSKAMRRLKAVQWEAEQTGRAFRQGDMASAYANAFALAAQAERMTILARDLPAHTGNPKAPFDLNDMLLDNCDVEVGYTAEGWLSVQMPALLPKKEQGNADYIRTMLYPALHRFFQVNAPLYLDRCVIVFRHVYHRDRPEREYRDHDNIELNMVVDMLAMYTMKDDTPLRCRHFYCSAAGDENRTEVYVTPADDFPRWLQAEKGYGEQAIRLFETP